MKTIPEELDYETLSKAIEHMFNKLFVYECPTKNLIVILNDFPQYQKEYPKIVIVSNCCYFAEITKEQRNLTTKEEFTIKLIRGQ